MSETLASELSRAVNAEARRRYPLVAKQLGISSVATSIAPRLDLRRHTPYPYKFAEDDQLHPLGENTFGRLVRKSRQEGLKEIHDSIGTATEEHGWLFVPPESLWMDTTLAADYANVDRDPCVHIFLSHLYPEIEAVHTHPDATVKKLAESEPWGYSENYQLEAAQPSVDDLIGHCMRVACTSQESRQVSTVVSHFGATSFVMNGNPSVFEGFRTEAYDRMARDPSDPTTAIQQLLGRMGAHVLRSDDTRAISVRFEPIQ